ncbi:MAG: glycosyl hydrolase, partial [Bacteroidota bacterium]
YFRLNTKTGHRKYITPRHKLGDAPYRWNWEAPIALSSHNQDIVYFGSNRFHRSMNMGDDFETLSNDLTKGGKKGDVSYGTLTTISESTLTFGLIYVGSDDGLIHRSKNVGDNWEKVSNGLPNDFWVSTVVASSHKEGRVYASLNGYRWDNFQAMVYVSDDYGNTWKSISSNLPTEPVNVVKEDPENENIIYVGTDHGVYVSLDRGASYQAFTKGLPNTPVHDLIVHPSEQELVLGTHGRGIYIGDVSLIQQLNTDILAQTLYAFPKDAITYSSRWGGKTWAWGEPIEAITDVAFYSNAKGNGKVEIIYKDDVVSSLNIEADKGVNFVKLSLKVDESFKELLDDEEKESYEVAESGDSFLIAGEYTIRITLGDTNVETPLTISEPKERPGRKE